MPTIKTTTAYKLARSSFIAQHGENAMLVGAIKSLEASLCSIITEKGRTLGFHSMRTSLPGRQYSILMCVYLFNPPTDEIAPCAIFFAYEMSRAQSVQTIIDRQIKAVKQELDW